MDLGALKESGISMGERSERKVFWL